MKITELRIGNIISFFSRHVKVVSLDAIENIVYYTDLNYICNDGFNYSSKEIDRFEPIQLTEEWLLRLPSDLVYPKWIEFVHDLQNWFYYNNKKELVFKI